MACKGSGREGPGGHVPPQSKSKGAMPPQLGWESNSIHAAYMRNKTLMTTILLDTYNLQLSCIM